MERVIDWLEQKNNCLIRFKDMNEREIQNFSEGNFDNLEAFYNDRETLLEMIGRLDRHIASEQSGPEAISEPAKQRIAEALRIKNSLVQDILEMDLMLISLIEQAKSAMIKDLSQVQAVRKVFGSASTPTGGRLDENF